MKSYVNYGLNLYTSEDSLNISYGEGVFGPIPEIRYLDDIRASLSVMDCKGPNELYCIAMDVGNEEDREEIKKRNLLFGVVTYSNGTIGDEPIRSQGHKHIVSKSCNSSTCEVYEIWEGEAYIYMQEYDEDFPGRCFAVYAKAGDVVIVPPYWVHATVNANISKRMTFGAWCVRDYGFEYAGVRKHNGIAYYPIVKDGNIVWIHNDKYQKSDFEVKNARKFSDFGINDDPIYIQFQKDKDKFLFVSNPKLKADEWRNFYL